MRKNTWRTLAIAAGVALLIWFLAGVILAGREPAPPPPGTEPLTLRGGRVTGNRISTRSWTFDYTHAQMSPDGSLATVDGVRHGILYKKGKPYLGIAAQHVNLNTQTFDFTATGDVHIEQLDSRDGIKKSFDTDLVQWLNATKMLSLSHTSLFRTGDQVLRVATITVNFNTNDVHLGKIEGSVKAPQH
ncbi:MAG TPA: hypothetical protein VFE17_10825 [Candidatus Baltobacteraceae bacterium]|jgi:hypothetical protein|nr:hypothetical protein [Candidatus Baltobacteraceae bacterium]